MPEIKELYFINNFEGRLVQILIRERKKLSVIQRRLWSAKNLDMSILKWQYDEELHRLKLIRILISQLLKTLREDDRYG